MSHLKVLHIVLQYTNVTIQLTVSGFPLQYGVAERKL